MSDMFKGLALQYSLPVLGSLFTGFVAWLLMQANKRLATFLQAKLDGHSEEAALSLLNRVTDVAGLVVGDLNQTVVDDLKAKAADGKLTQEEIQQVQSAALDKMKSIMGDKAMEKLKESTGDVEVLMRSAVEAQLQKMKMGK